MSSLSIGSSFDQNNAFFVQQLANGSYQMVMEGEEPQAGEQPTGLTEEELNAKLEAMGAGFRIVNGLQVASDGFSPYGSAPRSDANDFGADPVLPGISEPTVAPASMRNRVANLAQNEALTDAALMWLALSTLATSSQQEVKDARALRHLTQQQKLDTKRSEIKTTQQKIKEEKKAAWQQLGWSIGAAAVTFAAGFAGGRWGNTGNAIAGAANQIGPMIAQFGSALGKNSGAQASADKKSIELKKLEQMAEILDQSIEDSKASYDEAKESLKQALKIIDEHYEREAQTTNKIFQG